MRVIVYDIGNTLTKSATFVDGRMVSKDVKTFDQAFAALRSTQFEAPQQVILSSVMKTHHSLIQYLESRRVRVFELSHTTPIPFENRYSTPTTLGMDRLAGAAGACALYPGKNTLLIDAGTCIKIEFIEAGRIYHGGIISPGLQMRIDAMHHYTAKLPVVEKKWPEQIYGNSTITSLQNGALRGAIYELEGTIAAFKAQYGDVKVILAGGDADFIAAHLTTPGITVETDIVLQGLYHILQHQWTQAT